MCRAFYISSRLGQADKNVAAAADVGIESFVRREKRSATSVRRGFTLQTSSFLFFVDPVKEY